MRRLVDQILDGGTFVQTQHSGGQRDPNAGGRVLRQKDRGEPAKVWRWRSKCPRAPQTTVGNDAGHRRREPDSARPSDGRARFLAPGDFGNVMG